MTDSVSSTSGSWESVTLPGKCLKWMLLVHLKANKFFPSLFLSHVPLSSCTALSGVVSVCVYVSMSFCEEGEEERKRQNEREDVRLRISSQTRRQKGIAGKRQAWIGLLFMAHGIPYAFYHNISWSLYRARTWDHLKLLSNTTIL